MVLTIFLGAWLILLIAPETPIGRAIHRALVAWPAAKLTRIRRAHVLLVLLVVGIVVAAGLFEDDGIRLLSMAAPDVAAWASAFEMTTYLDVLAALLVSASTLRLRALRGVIRAIVTQLNRPRAPRGRRTRAKPPANDDERHPTFVALAA